MTAPSYFVFDGDPDANPPVPARTPTVDDLGGASFVDDDPPPDPEVFKCANDENQQEKVLAGLAATASKLIVSVGFSGGAPFVSGFQQAGTRLTTELLTLTDHGAGDTSIAWPADCLPPRNVGPMLTINENVDIDRQRATPAGDGLSVRVRTNLGATGTDAGFTVCIL